VRGRRSKEGGHRKEPSKKIVTLGPSVIEQGGARGDHIQRTDKKLLKKKKVALVLSTQKVAAGEKNPRADQKGSRN